jgi:antitoxin HigA-1
MLITSKWRIITTSEENAAMTVHRNTESKWAIHPGEILREEFLRPAHISANHLAHELGLSAPTINDIVLERRAITAETACYLARYFGTSEQFWLNLQAKFDIPRAERKLAKRLRHITPLAHAAKIRA